MTLAGDCCSCLLGLSGLCPASGFQKIGWGLGWILLLGGLRFAARARAWALCIEPPHALRFVDAFNAVVCGDALGNLTPLGPIVGEPAKIACVRGRVSVPAALTALAMENILYALSVGAMIAAGTIAMLFSVDLPAALREFSEIALGCIVLMFAIAAWLVWRRPAVISGLLQPHIQLHLQAQVACANLFLADLRQAFLLAGRSSPAVE